MSILKIDSSARIENSNSRALTEYLAQNINGTITHRDLVKQPLPAITAEDLIGMQTSSNEPRESLQQHIALSNTLINEFMSSNTLIIGAPIYNFNIPAVLKQWIDYIFRAGLTFQYTENGPASLVDIDRAFIITASGGTPVGSEMDFASRYLEHICRFFGINDVIHIDASGSKGSPEKIISQGKKQIDEALSTRL